MEQLSDHWNALRRRRLSGRFYRMGTLHGGPRHDSISHYRPARCVLQLHLFCISACFHRVSNFLPADILSVGPRRLSSNEWCKNAAKYRSTDLCNHVFGHPRYVKCMTCLSFSKKIADKYQWTEWGTTCPLLLSVLFSRPWARVSSLPSE